MFYIALDKANWSQLASIRNNIAGKLSFAIACCLFCSADLFFSYWPRFCAWKYITQTISINVYVLCQGKFRTKTPCSLSVIKKNVFQEWGDGTTHEESQAGDQSPGKINSLFTLWNKNQFYMISAILKSDVINYVICQLGLLVNLNLRLHDSAWPFDPFHVTGLFLLSIEIG